MAKKKQLTAKQFAFVEHYLMCWNASEAARRAGYSERSAYSIGHENLKKPEIMALIDAQAETMKVSANEVLLRIAAIARGDMADFLDVDIDGRVQIDWLKAKRNHALGLVKSVKITPTEWGKAVHFELYDKQGALNTLAKVHRLTADKVEIDWRVEIERSGVLEKAGVPSAGDLFEALVQQMVKVAE